MQRMKREVSPVLAGVLILVALGVVELLYWQGLLRDEHHAMGGGGAPAGRGPSAPSAPSVGMREVLVETIAGGAQVGDRDGSISDAPLDGPSAVATAGGVVYIADSGNDAIRMVKAGRLSSLIGARGGRGQEGGALLAAPAGVAVTPGGGAMVADTGHHRVLLVSRDGAVSTYAGAPTPKDDLGIEPGGYRDGPASQAQFRYPIGLAVDGSGAVYLADAGNHAVRRISPTGEVTTLPVNGQLRCPTAVCLASDGSIWVADTEGGSLWTGRPEGPLRQWRPKDGEPADGFSPAGLAVAADDSGIERVYVADSNANCIFRIDGDRLVLVAGEAGSAGAGVADGPGDQARFLCPAGLASGERGELYVADYGNNRVRLVHLGRTHVETHRHGGGRSGRRPPPERGGPTGRTKEAH